MKKFLSLVLALVMTFSLVTISAGAKGFTDKEKINYSEAVDVLTDIKVIDGYTDGSFNPTGNITRGAAAKIICNLVLGPTTAAALSADAKPFKDVATTNVFAGYIAYCSQQGIINGYADGTFKPAANVTGYQLLKMLLGALGYDGKTEGFTDANWSVNVAKLALALDLTKGNDEFVGTKAATREESCLYAFNTLKGTMVEYATKGTTITVNGATITQGASKASPVARTSGTDYTGVAETATGTLQFCEKYFKNLLVTATTDEFGRPANKWTYKGIKVGTYAKTATKSYTAQVKLGTIYTDLGLSEKVTTAAYYVDGVETANFVISKGNTTDKIGGNGVQVEVFKTVADNGTVTVKVVEIHTYVASVASVTSATASVDRYVTLTPKTTVASGSVSYKYETEGFAAKDLVSYTLAFNADANRYEVQTVATLTKTASGKLTAWAGADSTDGSSNFTAGGTTYKYSKHSYVDGASNPTTKGVYGYEVDNSELDVYCDAYGYALYVEGTKGVTNYATVIGVGSNNAYGNTSGGCTLLLADGTVKEVTYKMKSGSTLTAADSIIGGTGAQLVKDDIGDLVTYTVNTDGVYVLTVKDNFKNRTVASDKANYDASVANTSFTNGKSAITLGKNTDYYTTSNTVFFVCTTDSTDSSKRVYNVYTGYANMPTITSGTNVTTGYAVKLNSDYGKQIDAVYISVPTVSGISSVKTYVAKQSGADVYTDSTGSYYNLPAVVDGEVTTVKVDADLVVSTNPTVYFKNLTGVIALTNVTTNKGIVTSASLVSPVAQNQSGTYKTANGVVAANGTVLGMGGTLNTIQEMKNTATYWAYNDKTTVFYVDDEFKTITKSSTGGVATDTLDTAYFNVDSDTKYLKEVIVVDNNTRTVNAVTPVISAQPTAVECKQNESKTLSVTASVTDSGTLSYQWYKDGAKFGAASASATLNLDTSVAGTSNYYCVVTNTKNGSTASISSVTVAVTVKAAHNVIANISGNAAANVTCPTVQAYDNTTAMLTITLKDGVTGSVTVSVTGAVNNTNYGTYTLTDTTAETAKVYVPVGSADMVVNVVATTV